MKEKNRKYIEKYPLFLLKKLCLLYTSGQDFQAEEAEEQDNHLKQEILKYQKELLFFGLTFEKLADEAPVSYTHLWEMQTRRRYRLPRQQRRR